MKLARAIVFVKDVARMTAFYRDGLGLAVGHEEPGWVELDGVALHAIPPEIAAGIAIADPPQARESSAIKLAFAADDLDAARTCAIAAGARVGEIQSWGTCEGVDPEGNVFQLTSGR